MRALLTLLMVCAWLAGCGQKGGLYIPQDEPPETPPPASTVPAGQK